MKRVKAGVKSNSVPKVMGNCINRSDYCTVTLIKLSFNYIQVTIMPTEAPTQEWIKLSSGRYASAGRMEKDGKAFTLHNAANMDIDIFNREANHYGVRMDESDPPIDRMMKYSLFLTRRDDDGSAIMDNPGYVAASIEAAANKKVEPFSSFYHMLTHDHVDAVGEILTFKEKLTTGSNAGSYVAERKVFNEDAELEDRGDIIVAPEGWAEVLGLNGYPIRSSQKRCTIQNIETPGLDEINRLGYWYVGDDTVGQERIVIRAPGWNDASFLGASVCRGRSCSTGYVGALRSRITLPEDYKTEIRELKAEATELKRGIDSATSTLGQIVNR